MLWSEYLCPPLHPPIPRPCHQAIRMHIDAKILQGWPAWAVSLMLASPKLSAKMHLCVHMENSFPKAVPRARVCFLNHNAKWPSDPWSLSPPRLTLQYSHLTTIASSPWETREEHTIARWVSWFSDTPETQPWGHSAWDGTLWSSKVLETLEINNHLFKSLREN